jgi:putative membrane protein
MGTAELVPGVSGGTIAFITGIYDELLQSINNVDAEALRLLMKFRFADAWKKINGSFLLVLFGGIFTSLLSLASLMTYLLENSPIYIWSFFFGLILISAPLVLRQINKWTGLTAVALVLGLIVAYVITVLSPLATPNTLAFIF